MRIDFSNLINYKVKGFEVGEFDFEMLSRYKGLIKDKVYFEFVIETDNCGFFYNKALQIYSFSEINDFNNIDLINSKLKKEFGDIFNNLISFGQDLFGNQFCFDMHKSLIIFFNIETGERQLIATDFADWMKVLEKESDYYTGVTLLTVYMDKNSFDFNERLCPKKPFVIGGDYEVSNLYSSKFPDFLATNANIARQIFNLPNGTEVKVVVGERPKS